MFRIIILFVCFALSVQAKDFHLYYLGGQSNMDGYGYSKDLPVELQKPIDGVYIFHGNTAKDSRPVDGRGVWSQLRPGHGKGFKSDGKRNKYSGRFGVELTFATQLKELYPDRNIALIKYSRGGTSIDAEAARNFGCWDPAFKKGKGINQYDHFLATIRGAMDKKDIDGDGEIDRLIPAGIVWMQGESDAEATEEIARRYTANLKQLVDLIRVALLADDLPVTIGRISNSADAPTKREKVHKWKFDKLLRQAQADFVAEDKNAALVTSTDSYNYSDPFHYDSAGYIDLGIQFAKSLKDIPIE